MKLNFKIAPDIKKVDFYGVAPFWPTLVRKPQRYGKSVDTYSWQNFIRNTKKKELYVAIYQNWIINNYSTVILIIHMLWPFLVPYLKTVGATNPKFNTNLPLENTNIILKFQNNQTIITKVITQKPNVHRRRQRQQRQR